MMPHIDLERSEWQLLQKLFKRYLTGIRVWAYGSRVKWRARPNSDLDLVVFAMHEHRQAVSDLRDAFEESDLPFEVDLHVWDDVPLEFRRQIEEDYLEIFPNQDVAGEWREVAVGELAPFAYGKGLPEGRRNATGCVPVYGSNGVVGFHDVPLTNGATIVIGRKGTVGAVHYSPIPCWPIDTTFYITGAEPSRVRYLYYLLKSLGLEHMNADSAVPGLNRNAAHARRVRVPTTDDEQRAIAHILGTLDDKIELNRRMSETLEAMARALFKSWFVDFDPVRAKMEGRDPGMPGRGGFGTRPYADLFPDRLVDSELGPIPEGWEVATLRDVLGELVSGGRPKGGATELGVPSVGAENVISLGKYDFSKEKYVPREFFELLRRKGAAVRQGDVLLYKDGAQIGRKTYFDCGFPHVECAVNEHVFIIRAKDEIYQRFIFFWLDLNWVTQEIISLNSNSAQPGINQQGVRSLPLLKPPDEVVAGFDRFAKPLTNQLFKSCHASRTLATLRDALLPKLISGELRVKDAEKFIGRTI